MAPYDGKLFQETYADRCKQLGVPLNPKQESALEATIHYFFGPREPIEPISKDSLCNQTIDQKILKEACEQVSYATPRKLISIINSYATGNTRGQIHTDGDALGLYEESVKTIELRPHAKDPLFHMITQRNSDKRLKEYGIKTFKALKRYLLLKGIINQD